MSVVDVSAAVRWHAPLRALLAEVGMKHVSALGILAETDSLIPFGFCCITATSEFHHPRCRPYFFTMRHRFSDAFLVLHSYSRCPSLSHVNICSRTPKVILNNLFYHSFAYNKISRTWCIHLNQQLYFNLVLKHTLISDFFVPIFCLPVCACSGVFKTHWSLQK